jgi:hypothetical protein
MKDKIITLSGFGTLDEDARDRKTLEQGAKRHGVAFYPTYYDHELKGKRSEIEALTLDLWGMGSDEWAENMLQEQEVTN